MHIQYVYGLDLVNEGSNSALPLCPMVVDMYSEEKEEEEEEFEVQYWRKERHYRETYLESIEVSFYCNGKCMHGFLLQKNTDLLDSLLTDKDREILKKIKKPRPCT